MSSLLINEPPLQVLPSLAMAVGLNEAIVLQQIHYLLPFATTEYDGKKWVYNSYEEWQSQQFKFWSVATIKRTFANLQKLGLIICKKLQSKYRNQTNFYTIDYQKLSQIQATAQNETMSSAQNDTMDKLNMYHSIVSNCTDGAAQNDTMSSAQNEPILQENTNRIPIEYIHENEYARAQQNTQENFENLQNANESKKTTNNPSSVKKQKSDAKLNPNVIEKPADLDNQIWLDFLRVRKQRTNDDLSVTSWNRFINSVLLAQKETNHTLDEIFGFWIGETKWVGFKCDWYLKRLENQSKPIGSNTQSRKDELRDPKWQNIYGDNFYDNPLPQNTQINYYGD